MGSALTYSAIALRESRVRVLARVPFPKPAPSLFPTLLPVTSTLSYTNKVKKQQKKHPPPPPKKWMHLFIVFYIVAIAIAIETSILLPYLGVCAAAGRDSTKEFLQFGFKIGGLFATVICQIVHYRTHQDFQHLMGKKKKKERR